jgi:hypothetical protein
MRTREQYVAFVLRAIALLLIAFANSGCTTLSKRPDENPIINAKHPMIIEVNGRDLQKILDSAPPNSLVICNRNQTLILSTPLTIQKPITLQGLNAQLPKSLGNTPLLVVEAENVAITDFELTGNGDSVPQKDRCSLLLIRAGGFRIERGVFVNSSKDGVMIDGPSVEERDIVGGIVRDIVGLGCIRDVVSISGGGVHGHRIRNVLVDNIRVYDSSKRGAVEVSDGTDNITVRKVYAETSRYAVDIQDHSKPGEINSNVVVEDVFAIDCTHAIRTANRPLGHSNLTLLDITAQHCNAPLQISNTSTVTLQNVRIFDHPAGKPPISISDCNGVSVRDVAIRNSIHPGTALLIENCNDTFIDGLILQTGTSTLSSGICFRAGGDATFSGLHIHHISAQNVTSSGILLERSGRADLTDYIISDNLARVLDRIQGQRAVITNNLQ